MIPASDVTKRVLGAVPVWAEARRTVRIKPVQMTTSRVAVATRRHGPMPMIESDKLDGRLVRILKLRGSMTERKFMELSLGSIKVGPFSGGF